MDIKKLENNFYMTFSEKKIINDFFNEFKLIYNKTIDDIIKKIEITKDKKQNTKKLLSEIEKIKNPEKFFVYQKIDEIQKKLKSYKIKLDIPNNLEGDSFNLIINIKNKEDIKKILKVQSELEKFYEIFVKKN